MKKSELITTLRDPQTKASLFRKASNTLSLLLAKETKQKIESDENIVLVPILRAGMALLPAFMDVFETARVGFIGIHRDEKALPHTYYEKLPPITPKDQIIILDPMVATGGSTLCTIKKLRSKGAHPSHITIVSMIGAPEGKTAIQNAYPETQIHLAILDERLDAKKYIVPGLGDFGDRFFST